MKRKSWLVILTLIVGAGPVLFLGCDNSLTSELPSLPDNLFYNAVKDAAPDFSGSTTSTTAARAVTSWDWGDPIYELYGILVDTESGWDGYFNIYDVMRVAEQFFSGLTDDGTPISLQAVQSVVDVGFNDLTEKIKYDMVFEGTYTEDAFALDYRVFGRVDEADVAYMLSTAEFNTGEKNIIQAWYDQGTGDLAIGMFYANHTEATEMDPAGWEIVKAHITGNTQTQTFSLKVIRDGNGYDHNIVGYGISEGEGNHFLMQIANNSLSFAGAKYYEFAADLTVDEIKLMDASGLDTVPSNTADYADDLPTAYPETELAAVRDGIDSLDVTAVSYDE